jgi:hypothetical protein
MKLTKKDNLYRITRMMISQDSFIRGSFIENYELKLNILLILILKIF